jgi:SAM-dependent methyltransferase
VKPSLVNLLRSPLDGSALTLEITTQTPSEVIEGCLLDNSGNQFPIVAGIPLFAQEVATDETFAFKWQLIGASYGYEEQTRSTRQNWYLERFGFDTRDRLLEFLQSKTLILDAGTGSGVDSALFAESGKVVIAADLSQQAALATYRHLGHLANVHVLQADLRQLPFEAGIFDYISCDQVLHHTPNTADSFAALVRYLRHDGYIAIYVYKRKSPVREFTDDYIRQYTTQLTATECYEFCQAITSLGKALSDLRTEVIIPVDIPLLDIKAGPQDVQRFFYWNVMKCFWNDDYDFITNTVINFDWYHPHYAWRHTPEEVQSWLNLHGLEVVSFEVVPSGIAALGKLTVPPITNSSESSEG